MKTTLNITSLIAKQQGPLGLYVHVPFCKARCAYCDFYSQVDCSVERMKAYAEKLKTVIDELATCHPRIATLYFGGGTPSALRALLPELVAYAVRKLKLEKHAEITIEANPESLSESLLIALKQAGVTRVSLGVQACDSSALARLGRLHNHKQTSTALSLLKRSGLHFSADLIVGIPDTTPSDVSSWIAEILTFAPEHISVYPLSVEEDAPLAHIEAFQDISPDFQADCLEAAWDALAQAGYEHYEVANFALPGYASRHNSSYWHGIPYVGLGPSASSMLIREDGSRLRCTLTETLEDFLASEGLDVLGESEILGFTETGLSLALREDIMLAMRTREGVVQEMMHDAQLEDVARKLVEEKLCTFDARQNRYLPTEHGWLLGNEMFGALWCAE